MNALLLQLALTMTERGLMPDSAIRAGIRKLCRKRLEEENANDQTIIAQRTAALIARSKQGPIAPVPEAANEQHYELPAAFFDLALGNAKKYSSCYWPDDVHTLDDAETVSLDITCEHAALADGHDILELGCGWGSLTLHMAAKYPQCNITAVSNSASQRAYILNQAKQRSLKNITVITADMNDFNIDAKFDRVVSVEMFEHMRNYEKLMAKIADWLKPQGSLFVHVFCHRKLAYEFETNGPANWMGRYFFTGGIMPSADLLAAFQNDLTLTNRWLWSGTHYEKTANAWLINMDQHRAEIMTIFRNVYSQNATVWFHRWRVFFMACAELFGYDRGNEWAVAHYRFDLSPQSAAAINMNQNRKDISCAPA